MDGCTPSRKLEKFADIDYWAKKIDASTLANVPDHEGKHLRNLRSLPSRFNKARLLISGISLDHTKLTFITP